MVLLRKRLRGNLTCKHVIEAQQLVIEMNARLIELSINHPLQISEPCRGSIALHFARAQRLLHYHCPSVCGVQLQLELLVHLQVRPHQMPARPHHPQGSSAGGRGNERP